MNIKKNITDLSQNLPETCKLVAVSKTQPVERLMEAYQAGQRIFGENKVQELTAKQNELPPDIEWHMIGHLQTNKVKYIAPFVHLIHAVDSLKLLQEIDKQAKKNNRVIHCLLQLHIAEEESKHGFEEQEIKTLLGSAALEQLTHIQVSGLMGMATFTDNKEQIRREFRQVKKLFDELKTVRLPNVKMQELSMGMSGDYPIAVEEGSTLIRVGSAIFGARNYA